MFIGLYPRALKKVEKAWNHMVNYMGDQKPGVRLETQEAKVQILSKTVYECQFLLLYEKKSIEKIEGK